MHGPTDDTAVRTRQRATALLGRRESGNGVNER